MASRTNSLHAKLSVDLRKQVERDLVERPPGRETYRGVYDHYNLEARGISFTALTRYGQHLRNLSLNTHIRELSESVVAIDDLDDKNRDLIRVRIFEALHGEDLKLADLVKAAMADNLVTKSDVTQEQWEAKQADLQRALAKAEGDKSANPAEVLAETIDNIRAIYGLEGKG